MLLDILKKLFSEIDGKYFCNDILKNVFHKKHANYNYRYAIPLPPFIVKHRHVFLLEWNYSLILKRHKLYFNFKNNAIRTEYYELTLLYIFSLLLYFNKGKNIIYANESLQNILNLSYKLYKSNDFYKINESFAFFLTFLCIIYFEANKISITNGVDIIKTLQNIQLKQNNEIQNIININIQNYTNYNAPGK